MSVAKALRVSSRRWSAAWVGPVGKEGRPSSHAGFKLAVAALMCWAAGRGKRRRRHG